MSRSLNSVSLIGHVGQAPELRSTQSGGRVATFSLATSKKWTDGNGERQERTQWHRIVVWNRGRGTLADVIEKYVRKGSYLMVQGEIEYRQWVDKENVTRYSTEIIVDEFILLDGSSKSRDADPDARREYQNRQKERYQQNTKAKAPDNEFADFPGALQDDDDDLPFSTGDVDMTGELALGLTATSPDIPDALRSGH